MYTILTGINSSDLLGVAGIGRRRQCNPTGHFHGARCRHQGFAQLEVVSRPEGKQVGSRVQLVGQVSNVRWDGIHEVGGEGGRVGQGRDGGRVGQGRDGQAVGVGRGPGRLQRWVCWTEWV